MNLEKLSAKNYIELIKSKKISVTEATSFFLNRSKSINDKINSLITICEEEAIERQNTLMKISTILKKRNLLEFQSL